MKYVFDTNILVAALNGEARVVRRLNDLLSTDEPVLAAVAYAELRFGALTSQRVSDNLARIERMLPAFTFAVVDQAVAERFSSAKASLRRRGVTKSDADLLIAATALAHGAVLVTHDQALHDGWIDGLVVEDWLGGAG